MFKKVFQIGNILIINFFIILICFILIEIFSGDLIFKKGLKCSYVLCNANYNYTTDLYSKTKIKIKYLKDENGFRGRTNEIDKINILTVGGSTTDERYLNLNDTWSEKLEKLFLNKSVKIDVVNAGIDGQSTYGHIWNFNNWFNKIEKLKIDYIIFYVGINEKKQPGRHDLDISKVRYPKKILYILKYNNGLTSKIYEFLVHKKNPIDELNVAHSKNRKTNYVKVDSNIQYEFNSLGNNIEKLITLTKNLGAEPIFVTQKTLRWKKKNDEIYSISKKENFFMREKKISEIILNKCKIFKIFCLDGFKGIKLNLEDTYDLVHTSPSGSQKIAYFIFSNIRENINFN